MAHPDPDDRIRLLRYGWNIDSENRLKPSFPPMTPYVQIQHRLRRTPMGREVAPKQLVRVSSPATNQGTRAPRSRSRKTAQKLHRRFLEFTQVWWAQRDLNPRPSDYESPALTAELWARSGTADTIALEHITGKTFVNFKQEGKGSNAHSEDRI